MDHGKEKSSLAIRCHNYKTEVNNEMEEEKQM